MNLESKQKSESLPPFCTCADGGDVSNNDIAQVRRESENPIAQKFPKGKRARKVTFRQVWDWDNLLEADRLARKGKSSHYGVRKWDRNWWRNMTELQHELAEGRFQTGKPTLEERMCENKMRVLAKMHYKDHVAHHALMNICEPILNRSYYYESAASIKGRGIHYAQKHVRKFIDLNKDYDMWWVQIDFVKCYHHVNRALLQSKLCKMFKDEGIQQMFRGVVYALRDHNGLEPSDGTEGMGIGLYPVQPLVNFGFNDMDRKLAQMPDIKNFRYCDNVLIIGFSPEAVWDGAQFVLDYAKNVLKQPVHENIGIQKLTDNQPVDFVGYKFYRDHTLIRNSTKKNFLRTCRRKHGVEKRRALTSYKGWFQHADCLHLWQKGTNMYRFSDLNIKPQTVTADGKRYFDCRQVSAQSLVDREIVVKDFEEGIETSQGGGRTCILVEENGTEKKFFTKNAKLLGVLQQIKEQEGFPFMATLRMRSGNKGYPDYYFE